MSTIKALCISDEKGTQKHPVEKVLMRKDHGIVGDAHAGNWHRQVSLISADDIASFNAQGAQVSDGAFGENIIVSDIDFTTMPIGTHFKIGDVTLELAQIGKECHSRCHIYHKMGDCIMPRKGVFATVVDEGSISVGDTFNVV